MKRAILTHLLPLLLLPALPACAQYDSDYYFIAQPPAGVTPQTTPITTQPVGTPLTQPANQIPPIVQAAIVGVRNADKDKGIPYSIEAQIGITNTTSNTLYLDPHSLSLSGTGLWFNAPVIVPPAAITLAPHASAMLTAYFPFPGNRSADTFNLNTLSLTWHAISGNEQLAQSIVFLRVEPIDAADLSPYASTYGYYDTPYFYPGAWYGLGLFGAGPYYYRHHPQYWRHANSIHYSYVHHAVFAGASDGGGGLGSSSASSSSNHVVANTPSVSHIETAPGPSLPLNHR